MEYFQTKNPNLGKVWRVLLWQMLVFYSFGMFYVQPIGIFYDHLVLFLVISSFFPVLVCFSRKNLATLVLLLESVSLLHQESQFEEVCQLLDTH
jgi:hypothetical protein